LIGFLWKKNLFFRNPESNVIVFVQYPISFALNLAIPTDRVIGAKQVYCAAQTPGPPSAAGESADVKVNSSKGDEIDTDQLKVSHTAA